MSALFNIADAGLRAVGERNVLKLITEGAKRDERLEIRRQGGFSAKKRRVERYQLNHDIGILPWCGLTAVSCLTGASTGEVRELIREYRGDPSARVDGTLDQELVYAFDHLGFDAELVYFCHSPMYKGHPTMARWLREFERQKGVGYVVGQTAPPRKAGHWCVVHNDAYVCSRVPGLQWVSLDDAPGRRQRVQSAYAILKR